MIEQKAVNSFKEFLQKQCMDFMVVGSEALRICGLQIDPHDLDVEVICSPEKEVIFQALSLASNNNFFEKKEEYKDVQWEHKPYIFMFNGILVNVWVVKEFTHKVFVYKDYIKYAGVMSVLKEKMKLSRKKDHLFLINLIEQLVKL